jgi:Na+/melibiose symporter-like transporter
MQVWAYGMGHYLNDLVAACWFNYLFFYLKSVVQTPAASVAMLSGQVTDGLATPIVGFLSDRTKTSFGITCLT